MKLNRFLLAVAALATTVGIASAFTWTPPSGPPDNAPPNGMGTLGNYQTPAPSLTSGQMYPLQLDSSGNLLINCTTGCSGSGSTSTAINDGTVTSQKAGVGANGALSIQGVAGGTAVPISGTISNASIGTNGSAAPTSSTQVGGSDGTNLQPLQVDGSKNLKVNLATALPAGSAIVGKIGIDQTTPGTTNGVQDISDVAQGSTTSGQLGPLVQGAVTTGNPTYSNAQTSPLSLNTAGALRTVLVGSSVQTTPASSGGLSFKRLLVANNTTSVAVDASSGQLYGVEAFNNGTTIAYIKLYNLAQGSTTCGTSAPTWSMMIPAPASGGGGFISMNAMGITFSTAISACVTTGYADADATAPTANQFIVNFYYK